MFNGYFEVIVQKHKFIHLLIKLSLDRLYFLYLHSNILYTN